MIMWGISRVPLGGVPYHGGTQITKDLSPCSTEHLHGTHDVPHIYHVIPHGTEHPSW